MTRREFVARAGRYGSGAATGSMLALGLLAKASSSPADAVGGSAAESSGGPGGGPGDGRSGAPGPGRRVLILGAGLCGMAAAHELGKLGYTCEILEARVPSPADAAGPCARAPAKRRVGGPGTNRRFPGRFLHERRTGAHPRPSHEQRSDIARNSACRWRCSTTSTRARTIRSRDIGRVRMREARADLRGYVDELLAKADQQAMRSTVRSPPTTRTRSSNFCATTAA